MSWDDDFPDEQTDPAMVRPIAPGPSGAAQRPFPNEPSAAMRAQPGPGQFPSAHNFPSQPTGANPIAGFGNPGPQQRPITGGYPAAADDTFDGITPASGPFPVSPTGVQPIIRNNTSAGIPAVASRQDAVVTTKMRVQYAAIGVGVGVVIGLLLGLMNSALEDIPLGDGLPLTLQIAVWFGLMVGILSAWKPERFAHVWKRLTGSD